jgi:hypothetical protein
MGWAGGLACPQMQSTQGLRQLAPGGSQTPSHSRVFWRHLPRVNTSVLIRALTPSKGLLTALWEPWPSRQCLTVEPGSWSLSSGCLVSAWTLSCGTRTGLEEASLDVRTQSKPQLHGQAKALDDRCSGPGPTDAHRGQGLSWMREWTIARLSSLQVPLSKAGQRIGLITVIATGTIATQSYLPES